MQTDIQRERERDQKIQKLDLIGGYLQLFKIQIYNEQPQAIRINYLFHFYINCSWLVWYMAERLNKDFF